MYRVILLLLVSLACVMASAQSLNPYFADSLFQNGQYAKALSYYEILINEKHNTIDNYHRAALCYHYQKMYESALPYYEKAIELGHDPNVYYNYACALTQTDDFPKAMIMLHKAVDYGFDNYEYIQKDEELIPLHDFNEFVMLWDRVKENANPCTYNPAYRELDFILGKWDIHSPGGELLGYTSIVSVLDGCAIEESAIRLTGHEYQSNFTKTSANGLWQVTMSDNQGVTKIYTQSYKNRDELSLNYTSDSQRNIKQEKLHYTKLANGHLQLTYYESNDQGKTWLTMQSFIYKKATEQASKDYINHQLAKGKQYWLVLLKQGRQSEDSEATQQVQATHLQYLFTQHLMGKFPIFGPVTSEDSDLKGITIIDVATREEAEQVILAEPLITSGILRYEIYPWFSIPRFYLP